MEEDKNLNMDLFSEDTAIDLPESEDLEYLFGDPKDDDSEESLDDDNQEEENENNDDINNNEDENPESVVGKDNNDDTEDETDTDDVDDSSSNPNLFNSLATLLSEKGLISSVESKIETEEDFVDLFKNEIKKSEYSDLNSIQKEYLEKIREGIPHQKIEQDQQTIDKLDQITPEIMESDSDLGQRVIYQDFINKGFSDEKSRKLLQRSIELETVLEDATDALESIKEYSNDKIDAENTVIINDNKLREDKETARINSIKNKIKTTNEVIKDFPISDTIKEKVEKIMFDVVGENPNTKQSENALLKYRRENQEDFDYKLYYLFTITNGFKDFSNLTKTTKSRAIKDLKRAMASNTRIKDPSSPAYLQDPDSYLVDVGSHDDIVVD